MKAIKLDEVLPFCTVLLRIFNLLPISAQLIPVSSRKVITFSRSSRVVGAARQGVEVRGHPFASYLSAVAPRSVGICCGVTVNRYLLSVGRGPVRSGSLRWQFVSRRYKSVR